MTFEHTNANQQPHLKMTQNPVVLYLVVTPKEGTGILGNFQDHYELGLMSVLLPSEFLFIGLDCNEAEKVISTVGASGFGTDGIRRRLGQLQFLLDIKAFDVSEAKVLVVSHPEFLFWDFKIVFEDDGILVLNKPFEVRVDAPIKKGEKLSHWDTELTAADFFKLHCPDAQKVWLCHQLGNIVRSSAF